jgi:hypothetical protein
MLHKDGSGERSANMTMSQRGGERRDGLTMMMMMIAIDENGVIAMAG